MPFVAFSSLFTVDYVCPTAKLKPRAESHIALVTKSTLDPLILCTQLASFLCSPGQKLTALAAYSSSIL